MQTHNTTIDYLKQLGFNQLEAEVYVFLLGKTPMTAYKVGKALNKPTANVYKAIDVLSQKGAIIIESNKNKNCKAIQPKEFLKHYKKEIVDKTNKLEILLNDIEEDTYDEKTYSIKSSALVFERFRNMMSRATEIAVIDVFPEALDEVIDSINQAIKRGVKVYIQVYKPIEINGADVVLTSIADKTLTHWQSQQLNLIIDGEEYLIALLNNDLTEVVQANWSNNYYMACILLGGRMHEQTIMKLSANIDNEHLDNYVEQLIKQQKYFFNSNIPGFDKLKNNK